MKVWCISLVVVVRNNNTKAVIVNRPPTEFLPKRPPPTDAIHNVYELKTQPELVHYYHSAASSSTKPTWVKAIRNKQRIPNIVCRNVPGEPWYQF